MSTISVVIITKNEEAKIAKCLDSVKTFADEIIIVDDVSTDNTVKTAKQYGAKVFINEAKGNFDLQRNIGIEKARSEWILQMDADEIVPDDTAQKIKSAITNPGIFVAFKILRKNFFLGHPIRYSGNYVYSLKVLKKGAGRYTGRIHEILEINGPAGQIEADINHYPFNSINEAIERANFYTDIESMDFLRKNGSISEKRIKYELTLKSIKRFWKLYIKKQGYKDGMHGFIWCIINVIGPQMRWMKIWEKAQKNNVLVK
jgi:hypothetical protein